MKKMSALLLTAFVLAFSGSVQACPLGAKEDHLTIQRVMLNFGKYVSEADALALKGLRPNEVVQDSEFKNAIEKLNLAISCAEAVVKDPTGDVVPGHIAMIKDAAAQKEKMDDFIYFMGDFKDGLVEYRDLLSQQLSQSPKERDFKSIFEKMNEMNNRVSRAHTKLFN